MTSRGTLFGLLAAFAATITALAASRPLAAGGDGQAVDTALVLAVDISESVDADRYRLQMEGIALALEDQGVVDAILSGPRSGIVLALIGWADRAETLLSWQLIRTRGDAVRVAGAIRALPHSIGYYTCFAGMLRAVREQTLPSMPVAADRVVIDVSGDGIDNCEVHALADAARDALVADGVTINGLPIIVKGENDVVGSGTYRRPGFAFDDLGVDRDVTTLDAWYRSHAIGGAGAFLHVANGYDDFGRAFRQKFVTEISRGDQPRLRSAARTRASVTSGAHISMKR